MVIVVTSMGRYTFLPFLYRCYCEGIEKKSSEIEKCDMSWRHGNGRRSEKLCKNTRSAIDKWVANKVSYDKMY